MKLTINTKVRKLVPELHISYKEITVPKEAQFDAEVIAALKLNKTELEAYTSFRQKIAGDELLAVERLFAYSRRDDLPAPDPFTSIVIQASYETGIPITIFSVDSISSIEVCFATQSDVLVIGNTRQAIKSGSVIARTSRGILGVLGIKSATFGKLTSTTRRAVVLSFSCNPSTRGKSQQLVERVTRMLDKTKL